MCGHNQTLHTLTTCQRLGDQQSGEMSCCCCYHHNHGFIVVAVVVGGSMVGVTCGLRCFKFWMTCRRLGQLDLPTIISIILIIIQFINGDLTDHHGCHQVFSFSTPGDVPAPEELHRGGGDPQILWETRQQGRRLIIGQNMKLKSRPQTTTRQI